MFWVAIRSPLFILGNRLRTGRALAEGQEQRDADSGSGNTDNVHLEVDDHNESQEQPGKKLVVAHGPNKKSEADADHDAGRNVEAVHHKLRNSVKRIVDEVGTKEQRAKHQQCRRNANRQRHDGQMVQIRLGKIAICQSGLNLLAGKSTRNGVAEVAPHLKEDGDGKGECDGSCRARTRNDGKSAAKHAGGIDLGRNRRADHDGAHEHGLQSSADDNALLDIAKDQANEQARKQRTTKHRNAK